MKIVIRYYIRNILCFLFPVIGNELMRQEQYSAAVDCYTQAVQLDSRNAVYYCNRSVMWSSSILVLIWSYGRQKNCRIPWVFTEYLTSTRFIRIC